MELKYSNNNKTFKEMLREKNREEFYENFIVGDDITNYVVIGLGDDLIINEKQLLTMLNCSGVEFDFIDNTYEYANLIINKLPARIEVI